MQQVDIYKLIKAYRRLNDRCEFVMAVTPNRESWSKLNRKTQRLYNQCKKIKPDDEQKIDEYLGILNELVDEFNDLKMKNRA
ncbi:hypothetical protein [Clostridium sp. 1001283B150210_160208_E6]|uniref:hypothetical protein n=1 Tax=Clostridium sp. 1001283B150210_160208_E6 TaxID=2787129 RepID=UPI0018AC800E|nr:hypothetical protein [Clostridium sp. 1001283B150210_160208_E6]